MPYEMVHAKEASASFVSRPSPYWRPLPNHPTEAKQIVALDADIYLGGHGDPFTKAQLQANLDEVTERRAKIVQLFEAGRCSDPGELEHAILCQGSGMSDRDRQPAPEPHDEEDPGADTE